MNQNRLSAHGLFRTLVLLSMVLLAGCSSSDDEPAGLDGGSDAGNVNDGGLPPGSIDAPASSGVRDTMPADVLVVAPPPAPAPGCVWLEVLQCDTRMNIANYCDDYRVGRLQKCDGTTFMPDATYRNMYNLCSCAGGTAGSCCVGVPFHRVECCSN